jgi:hypothetical protein
MRVEVIGNKITCYCEAAAMVNIHIGAWIMQRSLEDSWCWLPLELRSRSQCGKLSKHPELTVGQGGMLQPAGIKRPFFLIEPF